MNRSTILPIIPGESSWKLGDVLMVSTLAKSPVPVRLSLRYSNGCVRSHSVRAVNYDRNSLRVLSPEQFEKGTTLSVLAPFFDGITTCWVFGISKSRQQPGLFEMDLQFAKKPVLVPQLPAKRHKQPRLAERDAMREPVELLMKSLHRLPPAPFSEVIHELSPESRSTALVATAAAVIFLLEGKGLVNRDRLVQHVREACKQ